jgi:hypothetical protein
VQDVSEYCCEYNEIGPAITIEITGQTYNRPEPARSHTCLEMQVVPLHVALPLASSSKQPVVKARETVIELPTGQMIGTWHDKIFELPFLIRNPENAMVYFLYSSEAVAGHNNPKIRVSMKLMNKKYGFYMHMEQVSHMI